jgi:hypothetical protein
MIDIDPGNGTAGTDRLLPANTEDYGGKMPALAEAAGCEADEARIPAFPGNNEDVRAGDRAGLLQLTDGRGGHGAFQLLALTVGGFQEAGNVIRLGRIRGEKEMDAELRVPQAPDGVQPRPEPEGQMIRREGRLDAGDPEQGPQAGAGRILQAFQTFPDDDPVFIQEGDDIRHGSEGGEIQALSEAVKALHCLADLQGDTGTAQGRKGIGTKEGIHDDIRRGKGFRRLVMIRDDNGQAEGFGEGDLVIIGNAAVHGNQEGTLASQLADSLFIQTVTLFMAGRDPISQGSAFLVEKIQED